MSAVRAGEGHPVQVLAMVVLLLSGCATGGPRGSLLPGLGHPKQRASKVCPCLREAVNAQERHCDSSTYRCGLIES